MTLPIRPLLRPEEAAHLLGVVPSRVRHIVSRHFRLGSRMYRFAVEDVREAWRPRDAVSDFDQELKRIETEGLPARPAPEPEHPIERGKIGSFRIPKFHVTGRVYFISGGGMIKIGYAKDPAKRLSELQTASAIELVLIGSMPGSVALEKYLHKRFSRLRERGEWFHAAPALKGFITAVITS